MDGQLHVTWIAHWENDNYEDPTKALGERDQFRHRLAIEQSIREQRIWVSGVKHDDLDAGRHLPLVNERWAYAWSSPAWAELMASVWSREVGIDYGYADFCLSAPLSPWDARFAAQVPELRSETSANKVTHAFASWWKRIPEHRQLARRSLLDGSDLTYQTLGRADPILSPSERVRVLRHAFEMDARVVPPISPGKDAAPSHEPSAHDLNVAAAALAAHLSSVVRDLHRTPFDGGRELEHRSEELYAVLLVQRHLEEVTNPAPERVDETRETED
ncbi:MAG: hypothetical protein JWN04_4772 [Myxococcaceae bacterium]|nr:hypothetical protein [Myxococcaceae bacterium]